MLERCIAFHEPKEGTPSDKRPQTEPQEHLTRGQLEEVNLGPPPTLRPELEHFLEMHTTSWGTRGRWGYPPVLSIKNYDLWLEWQACQLDPSHWWEDLTAIPEVGDIKKLAQKNHTSFNVPMVQYGDIKNQDYTAPPAPKCLKRGMFLPDNPSYQDIQLKPQLLSLAYAHALQYLAEEANPPAPGEPHPLPMSVRELKQCMGKYSTFNEHDVFEGSGNAIPEAKDRDMGPPPADSTT